MDTSKVIQEIFTKGVLLLSYDYNIQQDILNSKFETDEVEIDVESIVWTPQLKQKIQSIFNPIFSQYNFLWGDNIEIKISLHRKCHYKSLDFHTDYHDRKSDFFILFYPIEWDNNNGGQICFGIESENKDIVSQQIFFITTDMLLIVNNMNPLFKHAVLPCCNSEQRYLGCIEINRGTF